MSEVERPDPPRRDGARRALQLGPGLLVALAAAVVTAHGLTEVVIAARVPKQLAWLYPVLTDGLAATAYRATGRLTGRARSYAWFVVVLAAAVSGLAQAVYLASGALDASAGLRFGVGAWPAISAAVVAHLLYLLAEADRPSRSERAETEGDPSAGQGDRARFTDVGDGDGDRGEGGAKLESDSAARAPAVPSTTRKASDAEEVLDHASSTEAAGGDEVVNAGDDVEAMKDDVEKGDDGVGGADRSEPSPMSDGDKRAAAVEDWKEFLRAQPDASSDQKRAFRSTVAARYGYSSRWSYYRRGEAWDELLAAGEAGAEDSSGGGAAIDLEARRTVRRASESV